MEMTRDQAEAIANALPGSHRIDGHFIAAVASVAGVDPTFDGVADWLEGDRRHVLALYGERLIHVTGADGIPPVATVYRRTDVRKVSALEVGDPSYFTKFEWSVKRWSVDLGDGTTFSVPVSQAAGRQHDETAALMQNLMAGPTTQVR